MGTPPPPTPGDECATALPIAVSPGSGCTYTSLTTQGATQSTSPSCTSSSNDDDIWVSFVATGADQLFSYQNLVNTGPGGSSGLGFAVYDACGGTQLDCDFTFGDGQTGSQLVAGGFTTGSTYFVQLFLQGSNNEGTFDFCVQEVTCTAPIAAVTTVSSTSCPAGVSFNVDVTSLGSATSLTLTTDAGTTPVPVTAVGVYAVGPISGVTVVNFTAVHDQDASCTIAVGGFLVPGCAPDPPTGIVCTNAGAASSAYTDELDDLSNWTGDIGTSGGNWRSGSSTVSSNTGASAPESGSGFIYFEGSSGAGLTGTIVSGPIDLSNFEEDAEMSFSMFAFGGYMGTFNASVSTSPTGPFTNVFTYTGQLQTNNTSAAWAPAGVDLTAYVGQTIYLEFSNTAAATGSGDNWESDFSVDNLVIESCAAPPAVAPAAACAGPFTGTVDGSGTPAVVDIVDGSGNIIASIDNATENLGLVTVSLRGGSQRTTPNGDYILDRNVAISPAIMPTGLISVTIYVLGSEVTTLIGLDPLVNSVNDLQFAKVSGSSCSAEYTGGGVPIGVAAIPYGADWAFVSSVDQFSEFFVLPSAAPLPVELSSFNAYATTTGNRVEWTASTEVNLYMYSVERAVDPATFSAFADVAPRGTEYAEAVYASEDLSPAATTYYRLRMEDLDGTVEYSDVVAVSRDDVRGGFTLFPNPAHDKVTFDVSGDTFNDDNVNVVLTDLSGRMLRQWNLAAGQRTEISVSDIPSGVYMVSAVSANGVQSQRLIIE
ncbi:MAG: T9SS type A sorting domain-containing protein [Saprospiraceae bacterium]